MVEADKTILSIIHKEEGLEVRINEAAYGNVAIIGLFPAMFHSGIGSDIQKPFATVIVSGLSASLLFGIFISPLLFYIYESKHRHNT